MNFQDNTSGLETMSPSISTARNYHQWLLGKAYKHLGKHVLEVGVGYGDYTKLLKGRDLIVGIDVATDCVKHTQNLFSKEASVICREFDIEKDDPQELVKFNLDSAICFNVLEHIKNDVQFLEKIRSVIMPGGNLALIVPAHPFLYGSMDRLAGHFRRYTSSSIRLVAKKAGWKVKSCRYFNSLGALGWLLTGKILKPKTLADQKLNWQITVFDRLVLPLARLIDVFTSRFFGQSLIVILTRD